MHHNVKRVRLNDEKDEKLQQISNSLGIAPAVLLRMFANEGIERTYPHIGDSVAMLQELRRG